MPRYNAALQRELTMALDACRDSVAKAVGRDLSPEEEKVIARQAAKIKARIDAAGGGQRAAGTVLDNFMADRARIKAAKGQVAASNSLVDSALDAHIANTGDFATKAPGQALQSLFISSLKQFKGASNSVGKELTHSSATYQQAFLNDLHQSRLTGFAFDPAQQENLFKAYYAAQSGKDTAEFGATAAKIAALMKKHTDSIWLNKKDANIPLGKLEDWAGPQIHDQFAVNKAGGNPYGSDASAKAWVADHMQHLDFDRTFGGEFLAADNSLRQKRLGELWSQFASGEHIQYGKFDPTKNRELFYKNADSAYQMNAKYGNSRSLAENITQYLGYGGRDIALSKRLGSDPPSAVTRLVTRMEKSINENEDLTPAARARALDQLKHTKEKALKEWLPSFTGALANPEHAGAAQWLATARSATNTLATLGSVTVLPGDIPLSMRLLGQYGGAQAGGYLSQLKGSVAKMASLPADEQMRLAASGEILLTDALRPLTHANLDMPGSGIVTKLEKEGMRTAGHTAWVDRWRVNQIATWGHLSFLDKDKPYAALDAGRKAILDRFSITPQEWDVIRQQTPLAAGERTPIFTAGNIRSMDKEAFRPLTGDNASDAVLRRMKNAVADKYRNMIGDLADRSTTAPDAEMRAITQGGARAGTFNGELRNQFNALKGWVYNVTRNHLGAMIAGDSNPENIGWPRMFANFAKGTGGQPGGRLGMAKFMANMAAFGTLINTLSDIRDGKTPELPDSPEKAGEILWKGFLRQGAGAYGDLLASQLSNPDRSVFDTIGNSMSPLVGDAANMTQAVAKIANGGARYALDSEYGGDKFYKAFKSAGTQAAKVGYSALPLNFAYTKWATDYYMKDEMLESLNPGYKDRLRKRLAGQGQSLLLDGSQ